MKDLKNELEELKRRNHSGIKRILSLPADILTRRLEKKKISQFALRVGNRFPDVLMTTHVGEEVNLYSLIDKEFLIISYYRGTWCPFCSAELREYNHLLKDSSLNVNMIAISPENPDYTVRAIDVEKLEFKVLSDTSNRLAQKLRIVHKISKAYEFALKLSGVNLSKNQKNYEMQLPLPATYIVDQNKIIRYVWMNEDFTKRSEPSEVIHKYNLMRKEGNHEII